MGAGRAALAPHDDAVDDDGLDAVRRRDRVLVTGGLVHPLCIEQRQVGISAFADHAAALQAELTIPDLVQTIVLSRASGPTGRQEYSRP